MSTPISAKKGTGVDALLEQILLQAEILDLKANPEAKVHGAVLDALEFAGRIVAQLVESQQPRPQGKTFLDVMRDHEDGHAVLGPHAAGVRFDDPKQLDVGEMVVAIYTPEGDAIALSNGIMVHVHTMSRFIKWMIREGYEENPCIRDGDIFANNDAFIGTLNDAEQTRPRASRR